MKLPFTIAILILAPPLAGCGNQADPEVRFVVPDNFTGPLVIVADESGVEVAEEARVFKVEFPDSGVLRVKDDEFLRNSHRMTAYRANNDPIAIYPEGFTVGGLFGSTFTERGKLYAFYYIGTEQQASSIEREDYFKLLDEESDENEDE